MKKKILLSIATVLILISGLNAQKIYELDEVKQIPTIDNSNMDIIAMSIQSLFLEAIKEPLTSSPQSVETETVNSFYDSDYEKKLIEMKPLRGKQYAVSDSSRLRLNQISSYRSDILDTRLLFNLTFDEKGAIIVPDKIIVISYRTEDVKRDNSTYIEKVGLIAFELILSDSIKNILSQVRLKSLAGIDINSLSGKLKPVVIKCPFRLKYGISKSNKTTGHLTKRGKNIEISLKRYFKNTDEKNSIINLIIAQTDILTYKKGEFDFTIITEHSYRSVGFNIVADNIIANRVSKTSEGGSSIQAEKVISFSGEGKKIKK